MSTLTLQEAARLLKIHSVTLQEKARSGEIPGAKIGRGWVFVEIDLLEYIRSQYRRRALQGEQAEVSLCHSSSATTHRTGGSDSSTTDDAYSTELGLPTRRKPRSITTG
jgi:excisionase family DNA binding protein